MQRQATGRVQLLPTRQRRRRLRTPAHGSSDMPVWGPIRKGLDSRDTVNAARIENLVKYIGSNQAKAKA